MNKYLQQIKADIDLPLIKKSVLFALLFGFIVHGSNFFNPVYCHDSLLYHYQEADVFWKISLGRFMQAITIPLRGYDSIPLINGILSLIFIGLSSYVIAKTFDIKSRISIYCISALIITSVSYTSVNLMCFHELDPFMLAVLFASIGGYIFNKFRLGYIATTLPIALCCGLYQPYLSVAIMLLMILIIKDILNGVDSRNIIIKSAKAIGTLLLAGVIYFVLYKTIAYFADISFTQSYNNIESAFSFNLKTINSTIFITYWNAIKYFFFPYAGNLYVSSFIANFTIVFFMLLLGAKKIIQNKVTLLNCFILMTILILFPLVINIATFLSCGFFYEIMILSIVWIYILFLLIIKLSNARKRLKYTAYTLLFVLIYNGASFANRVYVDHSILEKNSHAVAFDLYKNITTNNQFIEDNNIPIYAVGDNFSLQMFYNKFLETTFFGGKGILFLKRYYTIIPLSTANYLTRSYFNFHFKTDLNFVPLEKNRDFTLDEELNSMPVYPAEGYIKCVRDTIFIKFPMEPQNFGVNK